MTRLWSGNFTKGSITVGNLSNYMLIVVELEGGVICIGSQTYGIGGVAGYGSYTINNYAYRFLASGNTLTIDNHNCGGTDGTKNIPVISIYGVV